MLLGINALNHDASVALVDCDTVRFASHAERYSRVKNDSNLNYHLLYDAYAYGEPSEIVWFEKPFLKGLRRMYSGQRPYFENITQYLRTYSLDKLPITYVPHHGAHAALGFYTSQFDDAVVLVVDAIGEWNCTSIWTADYRHGLKKVFSSNYPHSMGLFYSAATQAIGLKPNEEEYILMGMSAFGKPVFSKQLKKDYFKEWYPPYVKLNYNLHKGMYLMDEQNNNDFAASVQLIFEDYMFETCQWISEKLSSKNIIIVGGSALNCVANGKIRDIGLFDKMYVPANPGDAGLSIGAVAYKNARPISLDHAYLGHDINRPVSVNNIVDYLTHNLVVGVANGRAEWGPRALGNRSLLADPRGPDVKDRVNAVKHREPFRPFAPAILEEYADDYFDLSDDCNHYMQYVSRCKKPDEFPAIVHVDGTSRVQTVPKNSPSVIRPILEAWYQRTGCPMLLNTSLNIKGEPLVNSIADAYKFSSITKVPVF